MKQLMGQALKNVREENNSSSASITRLFFCGAFGDTTADSICSSLNQIKQQTEQHTASEQVTKITGGAMIVSNSAVVGFLECPSSVVATILSEIKSRNLLLNARILSTSEDCPCRWAAHKQHKMQTQLIQFNSCSPCLASLRFARPQGILHLGSILGQPSFGGRGHFLWGCNQHCRGNFLKNHCCCRAANRQLQRFQRRDSAPEDSVASILVEAHCL